MAVQDTEEVVDETTEETVVEETTETDEAGDEEFPSEISYEQALEWKKKAERLEKAEKKLVELKKASKREPAAVSSADQTVAYTKLDASIDKLVARNPSLEGYEDTLRSYVNKGNTLEEAVVLVENKNKTIKARESLGTLSITGGEPAVSKRSFTREALANMSQNDYNEARRLVELGKAVIKD